MYKATRKNKTHLIAFSPLGNGKYAKNIKSGLTLQDDFVMMIYRELIKKDKTRELNKYSMKFIKSF